MRCVVLVTFACEKSSHNDIYNITGLGISHVDLNIRVLIYVQVAVQIKIVKSIIRLNRVV